MDERLERVRCTGCKRIMLRRLTDEDDQIRSWCCCRLLERMDDRYREGYHFEIWQGGVMVVEGSGPDLDEVGREMVRYAVQYVQDGPITIKGSPQLHPPGGHGERAAGTQEGK
jgi:hypothetical protein